MKHLVALLWATLVVAGVGEAPARGPSENPPLIETGPVVGGTRVFWGDSDGNVLLWSPGTHPRVVYRAAAHSNQIQSISASTSLLLIAGKQILVGPPRGPFKPLSRKRFCPHGGITALDADGYRVAFVETYCRRRQPRTRVVVREFAGPKRTEVLTDVRGAADRWSLGVQIAGRYVAWSWGGWLKVADLTTGRFVYHAPDGALGFDLQSDGKLVAIKPRRGQKALADLVLYAAGGQTARLLSRRVFVEDGRVTPVRLADDHAVFVRRVGQSAAEIVVTDLIGRQHRIASFGTRFSSMRGKTGVYLLRGVDFDGRRATWAAKRDDRTSRVCGEICIWRASGAELVLVARAEHGRWVPHTIAERPFSGLQTGP